jgi:hypothetical protein
VRPVVVEEVLGPGAGGTRRFVAGSGWDDRQGTAVVER